MKKQDIVVGDIVKFEAGDEIPADGILLASTSLRVDESIFTGEPYANKTSIESEFEDDATYKSDFLLRGAIVIEGEGIYQITATGMDTEEGAKAIRFIKGAPEIVMQMCTSIAAGGDKGRIAKSCRNIRGKL